MKSLFYSLLALIVLSTSCKTAKVDLTHLERNGEVILRFERTPCYGTCPIFKAELYSNGLLLYNGKKFTDYIGCHYAVVTANEIAQVTTFIREAGFFNLENKYPVGGNAPMDLPGCKVYFKDGATEKQIEDKGWQTPSALVDIEKKIDSLIASKKLQFCDK